MTTSTAGITYGNGRFVAVRNRKVLVSTDGINATLPIAALDGTFDFQGIGFGAGTFVAVGSDGYITSSTTGAHGEWTARPAPAGFDRTLNDVAYGTNGLFVVVGHGETILTCAPQGLPPIIVRPPANAVVPRGRSVSMSVQTFKSLPESYQWFFNGELLPDQTRTNLVVMDVQPPQTGRYSVQVSNALGVVSLTNLLSVGELIKHAGMTITSGAPSYVTLQYSDNLQTGSIWQNLVGVYVGTLPALYIDTEPVTAHPSRFYRGSATGGSASWLKVRLYNELLITGLPGLTYRVEFDDTPGTVGPWTTALDLFATTSDMAWTDIQSGEYPQRVYRVTIVP